MELKDFLFQKLEDTGTSFIRALESEEEIEFNTIEQVMSYLRLLYRGFKTEYKSVYCRWEYLRLNFSYNIIECLEKNDLNHLMQFFNERNEIELGEYQFFKIIVTKKENSFKIKTDIYTFISVSKGTAFYLSEENAKEMIIEKLKYLKKHY